MKHRTQASNPSIETGHRNAAPKRNIHRIVASKASIKTIVTFTKIGVRVGYFEAEHRNKRNIGHEASNRSIEKKHQYDTSSSSSSSDDVSHTARYIYCSNNVFRSYTHSPPSFFFVFLLSLPQSYKLDGRAN